MGWLVGLLIVLLVITLIGHGLWVLGRLLINLLRRATGPDLFEGIEAVICPECGEAWSKASGKMRCPACHWPGQAAGDHSARARGAVGLLLQRLNRYRKAGLVPDLMGERIADALIAERDRLAPRSQPLTQAPARPEAPSRPRPESRPEPISSPLAEVSARVRSYRESRTEDRSAPDPEPTPSKPRPSLGGLLSAFMEERNIRWGELVGGLLIVGCSLALVLGYWDRIAERPMLRFGLANGVVAAFFGVGLHADRRWKLPTTAHGLLLIASLLVPLSVLAITSAGGQDANGPGMMVVELLALGGFFALLGRAGRSMGSSAPWAMAAGVVVPSVGILAAGRWADPGSATISLIALGSVTLLAHASATARCLMTYRHRGALDEPSADDLLRVLGTTAFASAVALGTLLEQAGGLADGLRNLAVLAPLAGAPSLAVGLTLWRNADSALLTHRVAGGAIASAGTMVMLSGVAITWPDPSGVIAIAAFDGLTLLAVALAFRIPSAIALAGGCLALSGLVASLALTGVIAPSETGAAELGDALTSAQSGTLLVPIVLLFEVTALGVLRIGRRDEARALALVAVLSAFGSIGLVTWHGFARPGDPSGVTWTFAALSAASLAGAACVALRPLFDSEGTPPEARWLAWAGSALMLATLIQGFVFRYGDTWELALPWSSALLGHATIASGAVALLVPRRSGGWEQARPIRSVLIRSAFITSIVAVISLFVHAPGVAASSLAAHLFWLSVVWLVISGDSGSRRLFWAFQAALTGSVVFAVAPWCSGRAWFSTDGVRWLDPRVFQAEGIALTLLGLGWIGVRLAARTVGEARPKDRRIELARQLMEPPWPTFDRLSTWAAVLFLSFLAVYGAMPGVAQELTPRGLAARLASATDSGAAARPVPPASSFEMLGIPHEPALGLGSWLLLSLVLATLIAGQWERFRRVDVLGMLLAMMMAVSLLAGRWENQVAVASAMRWGGAIGLLTLSAPIWARSRIALAVDRFGWKVPAGGTAGLRPMAIGLVVALAALPLLAMAAYLAGAALRVHPISPDLEGLWRSSGIVFAVLGLIGLIAIAASERIPEDSTTRSGLFRVAGGLLIALGTLAIVSVSALVVGSTLSGDPVVGPEPGSLFDRMGLAGSYAPPIVLVALTLAGYAIRERSAGFALSGGLVLGFGATVGWLLSGAAPARPRDPMLWLRIAQVNAIVGSAYALSWMGSVDAWRRRRGWVGPERGSPALAVQLALPAAMVGLVLVIGVLGLFLHPSPIQSRAAIADPIGWTAFLLTAGAAAVMAKRSGRDRVMGLIPRVAVGIAAMLAFGMASGDTGDWRTYQAMIVFQAVAAGGLLLFGWNRRGLRVEARLEGDGIITRWAALATVVVTMFAMMSYGFSPNRPVEWAAGGLSIAAVLWAALAGWSTGRGFLYLAGGLLNLAASFAYGEIQGVWLAPETIGFASMNLIVMAIPAPAWLWIELKAIRPVKGHRRGMTPFHRVAAWGATIVLTVMVSAWLFGDATGNQSGPSLGLGAVATIAAVAVALATGFWDDRSRSEVAGLYLLGLCSTGWLVAGFDLTTEMMGWIGTVVLAGYAVIAAALWSARDGFRRIGDRLGVPRFSEKDDPGFGLGWLIPANVTLSAAVVGLAVMVVFSNDDVIPRFSTAKAALATSLAIGLLARGERRSLLRATALGFGAAGAVTWGWAWVEPGSPTAVLDRASAAMVALTATAVGYGIGLVTIAPRATRWSRASRRMVPSLLVLAGLALIVVISGELLAAMAGEPVAISGAGLVATAATMLGASCAALVSAVVPGRDPLGLPERRRTVYVYGAEAMLALLAIHLGLTMPWLFSGIFARYWPVIILGLAFSGVGLGELFRRQRRLVLAEPLGRTGALLPVLPLLGAFWLEPKPGEDTLFLVLAGGLYATLALLRSSTGFAAMAALAFNAGLWTVLGRREGFGLLEHPQFWVVPPALCTLAGVYLNRDRLGEGRSAALRHVAAGAVYLSSTADLVLNGVAEDPWLPLMLGGLSLLGIFGGIALRVRGFLLLGTAFLGLSVFAMIWHAAVDLRQTWLWAASGIVAGILILAAFALFEKRRREVMEVVDRIRHWQP